MSWSMLKQRKPGIGAPNLDSDALTEWFLCLPCTTCHLVMLIALDKGGPMQTVIVEIL